MIPNRYENHIHSSYAHDISILVPDGSDELGTGGQDGSYSNQKRKQSPWTGWSSAQSTYVSQDTAVVTVSLQICSYAHKPIGPRPFSRVNAFLVLCARAKRRYPFRAHPLSVVPGTCQGPLGYLRRRRFPPKITHNVNRHSIPPARSRSRNETQHQRYLYYYQTLRRTHRAAERATSTSS